MSVKTKELLLAVVGIFLVVGLILYTGPFNKMFANASTAVTSTVTETTRSLSEKISSLTADDSHENEVNATLDASDQDVINNASVRKAKELGIASPLLADDEVMAALKADNKPALSNPGGSNGS